MLGHIFRTKTNKISESIRQHLHLFNRINPNHITVFSLPLSLLGCFFIIQRDYKFALGFIIISSFLDTLDGVIAKNTGQQTKFGDYLDALVDRYREIIFYAGFAISGFSIEAFFAVTGSLIISYAKARTALTIHIEDEDWPAIGEMLDRLLVLIIGMTVAIFLPKVLNLSTISLTLWSIAFITHTGAIQRIFYAKKLIIKHQTK